MKKNSKTASKVILVIFTLILIILFALIFSLLTSQKSADQEAEEAKQAAETNSTEISILAVGDNLIHGPIYRQAKNRATDGGYDFSYAYEAIVPYLADFDFKLINQETPLGGEELGLSSYPMFNSPTQLGDYLSSIGFNLVTHANNHVLDAGVQGITNTINYWKTQPNVTMGGIYESPTAADQLQIVEKDGVKIAFLTYTYDTNGLKLPADSSAVINYIDSEKILSDVAKAEEMADITLVMLHWGNEYEPQANDQQKQLSQLLADADVDIIIGSHPHVIQDVATLPQTDGGKCVCFYSLGNFISAQDRPATMLGAMAGIKLNYNADKDEINFTKVEFIPIVNQYNTGFSNIHIVPLADYTDEMASQHEVAGLSRGYFENLVKSTVNEKYINIR